MVDHYETIRKRKDGTLVPVSLTVSPIRASNGEIIGASKIARDISEKKEWEKAILALNKELESFNYSVSHDLKAPLRRIVNYAQILANEYTSALPDEAKNMLSKIVKNGNRMNALIENLLTLSKLGKKEIEKVQLNMDDLVKEVLDELIPAENSREISVIVNPLETASGDKELLRHVWENLTTNALKYSAPRDRTFIEIGSSAEDGQVTYYIRDNGVGFDMAYADSLFNAFKRLHSQADFEGSGIGLAIVGQIIGRHGGKVWAEAKVNEGASFYFTLPKNGGIN
jgi:light-regulated signal transduction histidine kinase (bacteriophytochrome)